MTLRKRIELEAYFKTSRRPSQQQFAELIESTLNKRDDQFLGRWKPGTTYRTGDIVIHNRALWELGPDPDGSEQRICAKIEPAPKDEPWQSLVIPVEDEDWIIVEVPGTEAEDPRPATMHANPRVIRVGIGTETPTAYVEIHQDGLGRWLFNPIDSTQATVSLTYEGGESSGPAVDQMIDGARAAWFTNAPDGYVFHTADTDVDHAVLAINQDGKVGIGTDAPHTHVQIINEKCGSFMFNLGTKVNPALGIVNLRPSCERHYLTMGVDNDVAALVTDSDHGFVFRHGGEAGIADHDIDINQGDVIATISPDQGGKIGIGMTPEAFHLDVRGISRSNGCYVNTDEQHVNHVQPLQSVDEKLCRLRPITFHWLAATGLDTDRRRLGFLAHEVDDVFPEAVETSEDLTKAVAYHTLVPVLVKAYQDQKVVIERLELRLAALEARVGNLEDED